MKLLRCVTALACAASLQAGQFTVPDSHSPDGRWSLVFEEPETDQFVFRAKCSETGRTTKPLAGPRSTDDDKLMFDCMARAARNVRAKTLQADSYHVSWNHDATLLAIEAGANKFGRFMLFRRTGGRFSKIGIPVDFSGKLMGFVRESSPKIHKMGVNRFREKDPLFEEYPRVCLLEEGCVAFSTYGAQCERAFQEIPEEIRDRVPNAPELYFLLHVPRSGPAAFLGFCQ